TERWRAAEATTDAAKASARATEYQVLLGARQAFFQARAQKALVRVAGETLANQERHLSQIQGFVAVGTRPEIDLAQARTDVANGRVALINAQTGSDGAKAQLNQATGAFGGTDYDVADDGLPPVAGEEQPAERLLPTALAARPEIASLDRQRAAQE